MKRRIAVTVHDPSCIRGPEQLRIAPITLILAVASALMIFISQFTPAYASAAPSAMSRPTAAMGTVEVPFGSGAALASGGAGKASVVWGDELFAERSICFNRDLAIASAALSAAAYNTHGAGEDGEAFGAAANLYTALVNMGFDAGTISFYNYPGGMLPGGAPGAYYYDHGADTAGYAFARKRIEAGGEAFDLVAIVVRGTSGDEWYSNFNVGRDGGGRHEGFGTAAANLLNSFETFMAENADAAYKTKILVTGHSRGAAVANLAAADLTSGFTFAARDNIYAYTFATPNTAKAPSNPLEKFLYMNIFNFINAGDFIPYLPLSAPGWDYLKYGRTFAFPAKGVSGDHEPKFTESVSDNYKALTGRNLAAFGGIGAVQSMTELMHGIAATDLEYYNMIYSNGSEEFSTYDFFYAVSGLLANSDNFAFNNISGILLMSSHEQFSPMMRLLLSNLINGSTINAHEPETYIAWMQSVDLGDLVSGAHGIHIHIDSPADVYIFDEAGNQAARVAAVRNRTAVESTQSVIEVITNGGVKDIYLLGNGAYEIETVGIDTGTMALNVRSVDLLTGAVLEAAQYRDIEVETDKTIRSGVFGESTISGMRLSVMDGEGNRIADIMPDGSETSPEADTAASPPPSGPVTEGAHEATPDGPPPAAPPETPAASASSPPPPPTAGTPSARPATAETPDSAALPTYVIIPLVSAAAIAACAVAIVLYRRRI